jgi:septal ring factor EnvC (AmiA/AmiB activator)
VDSLKTEVQGLMTRITSVSNGQVLSPATQNFMDRVRQIAGVPANAPEIDILEPPGHRAAEGKAKSTPISEASATEREMNRIERENRDLRTQLAPLQKSFEDSQAEVAALRKALQRSEATRPKMSARKEPAAQRSARFR